MRAGVGKPTRVSAGVPSKVCPEGARTPGETEVPTLPLKLGSSSMVWPVLGFSQTTFWRRTWVTLIRSPVDRQHSFPQTS